MGSMRPTGRLLPFANNIQRTQKQTVPSGFPQSLSGSETDVSTSNENLSREERYVVRHTARVEPQGQENQTQTNNNNNRNSLKESVTGSNRNSLKDSVGGGNSNRSSLDVSPSSHNTPITHNQDDSRPPRPTPIRWDLISELVYGIQKLLQKMQLINESWRSIYLHVRVRKSMDSTNLWQ